MGKIFFGFDVKQRVHNEIKSNTSMNNNSISSETAPKIKAAIV